MSIFKRKNSPVPVCQSGSEAQQGRRSSMEDTHVHFDDVSAKYFPNEPPMSRAFYAVYDGHGGRHAADLAEKYLHECVLKSDELKGKDVTDEKIIEVICGAYKRTDSIILRESMKDKWNDGCTVVSILLMNSKLYVANLGDAEAVIGRRQNGVLNAECITFKHKPTTADERKRIEDAGGHVVFGRVLGSLAVSRAFGDSEFKVPRNRSQSDFVSSDPFTRVVPIDQDIPFMIVACDGLWDRCTYQEAVDFVENLRKSGTSPTDAAKFLVRKVLDAGTLDNVSVIIVYFSW